MNNKACKIDMLGLDNRGEFALYDLTKYSISEILNEHNSQKGLLSMYDRSDIIIEDVFYDEFGGTWYFATAEDPQKFKTIKVYALKL